MKPHPFTCRIGIHDDEFVHIGKINAPRHPNGTGTMDVYEARCHTCGKWLGCRLFSAASACTEEYRRNLKRYAADAAEEAGDCFWRANRDAYILIFASGAGTFLGANIPHLAGAVTCGALSAFAAGCAYGFYRYHRRLAQRALVRRQRCLEGVKK